ncbi:hypothetical protein L1887_31049 [Cichorium endivia]|nr:hypothetical protein L1887_31049 [Cichorium endivia]
MTVGEQRSAIAAVVLGNQAVAGSKKEEAAIDRFPDLKAIDTTGPSANPNKNAESCSPPPSTIFKFKPFSDRSNGSECVFVAKETEERE